MEAVKIKMAVVVWRRMYRGWLLGKKSRLKTGSQSVVNKYA